MDDRTFKSIMQILSIHAHDLYLIISNEVGLVKEIVELPGYRALDVYSTRLQLFKEQKNSVVKASQLETLVNNLEQVKNSVVRIIAVYFDKKGYIIFLNDSNMLLGVVETKNSMKEALRVQQDASNRGLGYDTLYRIRNGTVLGEHKRQ